MLTPEELTGRVKSKKQQEQDEADRVRRENVDYAKRQVEENQKNLLAVADKLEAILRKRADDKWTDCTVWYKELFPECCAAAAVTLMMQVRDIVGMPATMNHGWSEPYREEGYLVEAQEYCSLEYKWPKA